MLPPETPHEHLECPRCEGPVPFALDDLMAASAVRPCPGCGRGVYVIMGKVSNFQPGERPDYDSGD